MDSKNNNNFFLRFIRASFTIIPGKPAYLRGLRVALLIGVPLFLGLHTGMFVEASLFVLASLNVTLIDMGGMRYKKISQIMLFLTFLNAVAATVAILIGSHIWIACLITAIWVGSVAMFGLLGHTGVMMAFVNSVVFVIMVALPGDKNSALHTFTIFIAGGFWAMLLSLLAWPISPYRPVRKAVARCFVENAKFLRKKASIISMDETESDNIVNGEKTIDAIHIKFRESIDEAYKMLSAERKGRMGNSDVEDALISLLHNISKDYRTLLSIMIWLKNDGQNVASSNVATIKAFLIDLATIQEEIAQLILYSKKSEKYILEKVDYLKETYLFGENRLIFGQNIEIQNILKEVINRTKDEIFHATKQHSSYRGKNNTSEHKSLRSDERIPFLKLLRNNLSLKSSCFRHAIRIGITAAMAVLLSNLLDMPRGFWMPLTVIVIMAPDFGGSFLVRSLQRGVGTILGGIFAALLLGSIQNEAMIFVFLLLFAFLAISLLTINYTLFVFFLTPLIITMYSISESGGYLISYDRILDTLAGIALTLLGGGLIFPIWERNIFVSRFSSMLTTIQNHLDAMLLAIGGEQIPLQRLITLSREMELAASNANASFQHALAQPGFNKKLIQPMMLFLSTSNKMMRAITTIREYYEANGTSKDNPEVFLQTGRKISELLNLMASSILLQQSKNKRSCDDIDTAIEKMKIIRKQIESTHIPRRNMFEIEIIRIVEFELAMLDEIYSLFRHCKTIKESSLKSLKM